MSEKKLWSRNETLQLIEKFQQNRGLWDTTMGRNSAYLKKIKRNTLQKLATEFNTSDLEVGRKLHNLKTQFSQEYKKEQQQTSSGEVYKSKWQYFDMMKFLQPTTDQNGSSTTDDSMNSSTNSRVEAIEDELITRTPSVKRNKKCAPLRKFHTEDYPRPSRIPDRLDDEYQIFGDYVANEIRSMHFLRYKGILKRKIQRLIIEFTGLDDEEYLKREEGEVHVNGRSESPYQSKAGPSHVKDENEISESMYLVINGVKNFFDNSLQRQEDPLGKV